MNQIVVGVDGSEGGSRALQWAAREAEVRDAEVVAVLAWGFLDEHHTIVGSHSDMVGGDDDAYAALDEFVSAALGRTAAAKVRRHVAFDLPARALLESAVHATLLVLGPRGLGGFRGLMLGSVSERCLHRATCPVAIVRPTDRPLDSFEIDRIVVGVDGSDNGQLALRWAIDEAQLHGGQLDVVHAWQFPHVGGYPYMSVAPLGLDRLEKAAEELLEAMLEQEHKRVDQLERRPRRVVRCGGAAGTILDVAADAQLIVVGSRGRGPAKDLLLGSVSRQLARHAECPLVVVPTPTR